MELHNRSLACEVIVAPLLRASENNGTCSVRPDASVVVTCTLTLPRRRYTAAEGTAIADGVKKLVSEGLVHLEFTDQVKQLLTDGKEKEALALARERVQADPKNADALVRLASTLSAVGANDLAIETCRQATKLDPKSSAAFAQLADLDTRDETGRAFKQGMQYNEAVEALRHAIELDPKDTGLSLKLAIVYQHDAKGVLFAKHSQAGEAVATLRKIEPELAKLNALNNLPYALLFNRQYADVKSFYEKDPSHARWSYRLAAIAASDGVEAAVSAWEGAQTNETRQAAFTEAAGYLLFLREYQAAAGLLREAEKGAASEDADLLAHTRPRENARSASEPPVGLTQKLIYALLDPDDEESWKNLYVTEWRELKLRDERRDMLGLLRAWRQVAKHELGLEAIADVAVSNGAFVS